MPRHRSKKAPVSITAIVIAVIVIGLLVIFGIPVFSSVSATGAAVVQLSHLKSLGRALRTYAEEHGGRFPAQISDLPPENVPENIRQFVDWNTHEKLDWQYFPGHTTHDPPDTVLVVSPATRTGNAMKRVVLNVDTSGAIIPEQDFQEGNPPQHTPGGNPVDGKTTPAPTP